MKKFILVLIALSSLLSFQLAASDLHLGQAVIVATLDGGFEYAEVEGFFSDKIGIRYWDSANGSYTGAQYRADRSSIGIRTGCSDGVCIDEAVVSPTNVPAGFEFAQIAAIFPSGKLALNWWNSEKQTYTSGRVLMLRDKIGKRSGFRDGLSVGDKVLVATGNNTFEQADIIAIFTNGTFAITYRANHSRYIVARNILTKAFGESKDDCRKASTKD